MFGVDLCIVGNLNLRCAGSPLFINLAKGFCDRNLQSKDRTMVKNLDLQRGLTFQAMRQPNWVQYLPMLGSHAELLQKKARISSVRIPHSVPSIQSGQLRRPYKARP